MNKIEKKLRQDVKDLKRSVKIYEQWHYEKLDAVKKAEDLLESYLNDL